MPNQKINRIDLTQVKSMKQENLAKQLEEAAKKDDHTVVEVAFEDLFPASQGFSFEVTSTEK